MEENKKSYPYSMILLDDDNEIVERLKELTGLRNTSDIIRQSLRSYHKELEPLYVRKKSDTPKRATYTSSQDRVKAQLERKKEDEEAKKEIEYQKALAIANQLNGEIITQDNGNHACKFTLYEKVGNKVVKGSRTIPFENLHESVLETQFKGGSKEEILAIINKN